MEELNLLGYDTISLHMLFLLTERDKLIEQIISFKDNILEVLDPLLGYIPENVDDAL